MLKWFFTNSDKTLWLGTAPNTRAEKFYTHSGWQNCGLRKNGEVKFEMSYNAWVRNNPLKTLLFPVIKTERLILRKLSIFDDKEIFFLRSDDGGLKYLDIPKAETIADARKFISNINEGLELNEWFYWAITLINHDSLIGTICLWKFSSDRSEAEIGYQLLPEFQGKGYMQEAIQKIIEYSFIDLKLKKILAGLSPRNSKSINILERNNFIKIEALENPHDSVCYSLERRNI